MATNIPVGVPPQPEPGYLTTEFWMALATSVIGLLILFNVIKVTTEQQQAILGLIGLVAPQVIYILSRGIRKIGQ